MKKRLLFVNGHLNTGGVEKSLVDLMNSLDCDKYDVDLILLEGNGEYLDLLNNNIHVIKYDISCTYGNFLFVLKKALEMREVFPVVLKWKLYWAKKNGKHDFYYAKKLFNLKEYDVAIAYRVDYSCEFVIDAIQARKKIVWWHHGACDYNSSMLGKFRKEFLDCDNVVTVSDGAKKMLEEKFPIVKDKISIVPNMINPENIIKQAKEFEPKIEKKKINILSVGRLSPEKNFELIIRVAQILKEKNFDFCWRIIGDGVQKNVLINQINEKQLSDCVYLMGSLKNPYPYYKISDVFVHPSIVESQSIVVLEAMIFQLSAVVVKSIGPMGIIKDGINGFLVENNSEEMTNRIITIIEGYCFDKNKMRDTVKQYMPEMVVEKFERLLN